jgi:hypothetical protein
LRRVANYERRQVYDSENASSKGPAWESRAGLRWFRDLFIAESAERLVWRPILGWLVDHK